MDNNLLEMLVKMMSPTQTSQPFTTSYPQDNLDKSRQEGFGYQNNMMPLLLSLLNKSQTSNTMGADKKEENKKAEVPSASNDEILL